MLVLSSFFSLIVIFIVRRIVYPLKTLTDELKQQQKDTRTARSDYKHIVENLNKLHEEFNEIQNENKQYNVIFAEIKKMSIMERILGKYPDDIKELKP